MTLASLTPEGVLAAVAEFDRLGRDEFLRTTGFGKAKSYFLDLDGVLYDSKAIVGRALGLAPQDFTGGDQSVVPRLQALGFSTRYFPVLPWIREEIVLASAVVEANGWRQPTQARDPRILEVSALLQSSAFHPADQHGPDFRNPASVGRKMADIATSHPDYRGTRTHGNRLDRVVVDEFLARPDELREEAAKIKARLLSRQDWQTASPEPSQGVIRPASTGKIDVRDVPVEAHQTVDFEVRPRSDRITAERREAQLVQRYQAWLHAAGRTAIAKLIFIDGYAGQLRIDLYDAGRDEIIEAKGSSERDYIRFALGQILDYARYIPEHKSLAVLLPSRPRDDLLTLLLDHHVSCIFENGRGAFERVGAAEA